MKFGYQGGFSTPTKNYFYDSTVIQVRTNNGVPNQITENLAYPGWLRTGRHVIPVNFYGQDQWTRGRLTLQGGVRWDNGDHELYVRPDRRSGLYPHADAGLVPHRVDPGDRLEGHHSPGGRGLRSVREREDGHQSQHRQVHGRPQFAVRVGHEPDLPHPHDDDAAVAESHQFQFHQQPGLRPRNPAAQPDCGPMANQSFGTQVFNTNYDPNMVTGWGNRPVRVVDGSCRFSRSSCRVWR